MGPPQVGAPSVPACAGGVCDVVQLSPPVQSCIQTRIFRVSYIYTRNSLEHVVCVYDTLLRQD